MDEKTDKLRRKEPCKQCGSTWIDFKKEIVQMYDDGRDKMTVWCFCRNCGHRGMSVTQRFVDLDDAKDAAYTLWNSKG